MKKPVKLPKTLKELAYKFWYEGPNYAKQTYYLKMMKAAIKLNEEKTNTSK